MYKIKKKAYAKINLCLNTLFKREDNYHELEMIMINVDLYDELCFKESNDVIIEMNKDVCKMEDNIVYKTVMLIKNRYHIDKGIKIRIKKNIPDQAGLGGGSSDAACTILALNDLWNLNLKENELLDIASTIGSDVPFFIYNKLSIVRGRGEKIETVEKEFNKDIILLVPNVKCSTKEIYKNHIIESHNSNVLDFISNLENNYYDYMFNDLEKTASNLYPEYKLADLKNLLIKIGCRKAMMSGSGSAVYGIGYKPNKQQIKELRKFDKDLSIYVCKTISGCK